MGYQFNKLANISSGTKGGKITWRSPSNIAIVKYWGKFGRQIPRNPSLSLTLDNAYTETTLLYCVKQKKDDNIDLDFYFEGQPQEAFKKRMHTFLKSIVGFFPFLTKFHLRIESHNSFPHSAGIASSASAMSALALCLCTMEELLDENQSPQSNDEFLKKASFIARLGSGSAARSVYGHAAVWGEMSGLADSSNKHAIGMEDKMHDVFKGFHDDILLVNKKEKSVSSSAGHNLMNNNPFAEIRYQQAFNNMDNLLDIMKVGDVDGFGTLAEAEALSLHALMMTSTPSYILMHPHSLSIIEKVRAFRADTQKPLYFTLDAGPNVHLLYPDAYATEIQSFIASDLAVFCADGHYIQDKVGEGPQILSA